MASRWICIDVRSAGVAIGTGIAGWSGRRVADVHEAGFRDPGSGDAAEPPAGREGRDGLDASVARELGHYLESRPGRYEGLLTALPDRWFQIGLVRAAVPGGAGRLAEYAAWKVRSDWNLDPEATAFDWQPVSRRRGVSEILLVAAGKALLESAGALGKPWGLGTAVIVPRCVAAWNLSERSFRGREARAAILRDGTTFTFFGVAGGTLRYIRSRACDDPGERDAEIEETRRHFRESIGASGGADRDRFLEDGGARVLEGLLRQPLAVGVTP